MCQSDFIKDYLVGGLEHVLFSHLLGSSSSQLTFIFFRGGETTTNHHHPERCLAVCTLMVFVRLFAPAMCCESFLTG